MHTRKSVTITINNRLGILTQADAQQSRQDCVQKHPDIFQHRMFCQIKYGRLEVDVSLGEGKRNMTVKKKTFTES